MGKIFADDVDGQGQGMLHPKLQLLYMLPLLDLSTLPNLIPNATLFCRNDTIWFQEGVLTQPFQVIIAIDWFFATQFVSWS